jgi:5-methylcytosine-specific restriction endonuclease McrA
MKKTALNKVSKASASRLQKKCDNLLTPIVAKENPYCLLCGQPTQVAHHHVHKSKSNRLRHDLKNLINLCHKCHMALHHNESYYASRIISIKGTKWNEYILKAKRESVKTGKAYYQNIYEKLTKLL